MDLKKQIIVYMGELDHTPETSFEKDVVCEDEESFCLSRDNITSLKLLLCQARTMLHATSTEGKAFLTIKQLNTATVAFLRILQLEERKAENEAICEAHREKIQQLWDRLQVPQEEREPFNEHMVTSRRRNLEAVRSVPSVRCCFFGSVQFG